MENRHLQVGSLLWSLVFVITCVNTVELMVPLVREAVVLNDFRAMVVL